MIAWMPSRRSLPLAMAVVVLTLTALVVGSSLPTQRAGAADADELICRGVDLAPRLASDRGTPPAQTLDGRGRYVPVVMVHGWTSRATHTRARSGTFSHLIDLTTTPGTRLPAPRSLVGQLQRIPGAAVFTFDYHDDSAHWVTHDALGPALARAIDCLYEKSGQEKIIVVAHSLGGLITRFALTRDADGGAERARRVSTVATFGTPQTGSLVAALVAGVIDVGSAAGNRALGMIRLILSYCGTLTTENLKTGTLCDILPDFVQAFDSESGRALRSGSRELRDLDPFPTSVTTLDATAGDTVLKVRDAGWFAAPWDTDDVNVGDVIVMTDSATHRARPKTLAHCAYQLNATRGATDQISLSLGQVSQSDVAQPLWKVMGPCFHTNLMRTINLTNEVTGAINADISGRPANTTPQVSLTPEAVADDNLPVCREYSKMERGEKDVVLRRMQDDHGDTMTPIVARISVNLFCKLNPGRLIDGVYAPPPRSGPEDGGGGPAPVCSQWREMDDAASDAALLRIARQRGDSDPSISTLRLSVGAYCAIFPDRRIDAAYGG